MNELTARKGDKIIFTGASKGQREYGVYTGNFDNLIIGNIYTIKRKEMHSWHTKIFLLEEKGSFNSVCFDDLEELI